ncbi:MAG: hypothetical protein V4702_00715 [Patescibacteria group bacterium]
MNKSNRWSTPLFHSQFFGYVQRILLVWYCPLGLAAGLGISVYEIGFDLAVLMYGFIGVIVMYFFGWILYISAELSRNLTARFTSVYLLLDTRLEIPRYLSDAKLLHYDLKLSPDRIKNKNLRASWLQTLVAFIIFGLLFFTLAFSLMLSSAFLVQAIYPGVLEFKLPSTQA